MQNSIRYTLLDGVAVRTITSSTNAAPIVVTAAGHGFSTGDRVTINGHTTNTAANGTWTVTRVGASTFSLDGSTGNGAGGNDGAFALAAKIILGVDFRNAILTIGTDGGADAAMTVKIVTSDQEDSPDFAAPQSVTNEYDFTDSVDLEDGTPVDGDTGFVVATADNHVRYEVNTNGQRWVSVLPTAGTAGEITVKATLFYY